MRFRASFVSYRVCSVSSRGPLTTVNPLSLVFALASFRRAAISGSPSESSDVDGLMRCRRLPFFRRARFDVTTFWTASVDALSLLGADSAALSEKPAVRVCSMHMSTSSTAGGGKREDGLFSSFFDVVAHAPFRGDGDRSHACALSTCMSG